MMSRSWRRLRTDRGKYLVSCSDFEENWWVAFSKTCIDRKEVGLSFNYIIVGKTHRFNERLSSPS